MRWVVRCDDFPLTTVERSPTGSEMGKSTDSRMMAKKIHQPNMQVTKVKAPPAWVGEKGLCNRQQSLPVRPQGMF